MPNEFDRANTDRPQLNSPVFMESIMKECTPTTTHKVMTYATNIAKDALYGGATLGIISEGALLVPGAIIGAIGGVMDGYDALEGEQARCQLKLVDEAWRKSQSKSEKP